MNRKKIVVLGLGLRGSIYTKYCYEHPEQFEIVGVIDTDEEKRKYALNEFKAGKVWADYRDFLAERPDADVVAVCTQDKQHREHAVALLEKGYNLILEKPMATTKEDCIAICETAKKYDRKVIVCHVLRYTPFYRKIKSLIDDGTLGEVMSVQTTENVGWFHQAHSFVRGPWRNEKESSPMILAKCCHDMDILYWLLGKKPVRINSIGALSYFKKENMPADAKQYCSDCPNLDCIYRAQNFYPRTSPEFKSYISVGKVSNEKLLADLKHSQYDRCVYLCDNDVVDHQTTLIQFDGNITCSHTMTAFSNLCCREIKLNCTKAEVYGYMTGDVQYIDIYFFKGQRAHIDVTDESAVGGHCGGDYFLMNDVYKVLNGEMPKGISYIEDSLESHMMAFRAEESRLKNM